MKKSGNLVELWEDPSKRLLCVRRTRKKQTGGVQEVKPIYQRSLPLYKDGIGYHEKRFFKMPKRGSQRPS